MYHVKYPTTVVISVTQEDLTDYKYMSNHDCAGARACKRVFDNFDWIGGKEIILTSYEEWRFEDTTTLIFYLGRKKPHPFEFVAWKHTQ